jgi:chloramphenicol-sensitive protein RarD
LHAGIQTDLLIILSGIVTTIPLLLFASATQKISLSLIGILQYIAPTLQFLIGVFIYREAITQIQLFGFGMVWIALIFFALEGLVFGRRLPQIVD